MPRPRSAPAPHRAGPRIGISLLPASVPVTLIVSTPVPVSIFVSIPVHISMPVLVPVLVTCLRASAALRSQHPFIANAPDKAILAGLLEQVFKFSEVCLSLSLSPLLSMQRDRRNLLHGCAVQGDILVRVPAADRAPSGR